MAQDPPADSDPQRNDDREAPPRHGRDACRAPRIQPIMAPRVTTSNRVSKPGRNARRAPRVHPIMMQQTETVLRNDGASDSVIVHAENPGERSHLPLVPPSNMSTTPTITHLPQAFIPPRVYSNLVPLGNRHVTALDIASMSVAQARSFVEMRRPPTPKQAYNSSLPISGQALSHLPRTLQTMSGLGEIDSGYTAIRIARDTGIAHCEAARAYQTGSGTQTGRLKLQFARHHADPPEPTAPAREGGGRME